MSEENSKLNSNVIQEHILEQIKLDNLPEGQQVMLLKKMTDVISQRILGRILKKLDEKKQAIFFKILDNGSQDEQENFISQEIPDFFDVMFEEITKLKEQMVAHLEK